MSQTIPTRKFRFPECMGQPVSQEERDRLRPIFARMRGIAREAKERIWLLGNPSKRPNGRFKALQKKRIVKKPHKRPVRGFNIVEPYIDPALPKTPVSVQERERAGIHKSSVVQSFVPSVGRRPRQ